MRLLTMFVLFWVALPAAAQSTQGSIFGRVTDPSGASVAGAAITARQVATGRTYEGATNAEGEYLLLSLPTGPYTVEANIAGFKRTVRSGVEVLLNQNARVDLVLEVGQVTEQIEVSASAPLVETRQAQLGGTVDERRVNELPLNGRNVYDLVSILPGVARVNTPEVLDINGNQMVVNGNRSRQNTFLLDGAFNNDIWRNQGNQAPNPDAVEQFRLITSNFNAEYGRSPGGVVNVITKSGTNQFHGSAFEFLRNSALNARSFFQPTVNPVRQNQFGASLGGPVIRKKTFFFGSWQSLRIRRQAFVNSGLTPTAAERAGDFSGAPAAQRPRDPLTNQAFPNGIIPSNRLDPVALRMLRFVPQPNVGNRFEQFASQPTNEDQWTGKIDHQLNPQHRAYFTMFFMRNNLTEPFSNGSQTPDWGAIDTQVVQRNLIGGHDWVISPSSLNQFQFSSTLYELNRISLNRVTWSDLGSQMRSAMEPSYPPLLNITGRFRTGSVGDGYGMRISNGFQDTWSMIRGGHSLKAGVWMLWHKHISLSNFNAPGNLTFNGSVTGNSLSDFLLGRAATLVQGNGTDSDFRGANYHFYFQDDWKVSRRLTLNLGLRYELDTPFSEVQDRISVVRYRQQSTRFPTAPLGLVYPGDAGVPSGLVPLDRNNFAPRVGLAYDVFGNGRTAVRAGYGLFYATSFSNLLSGTAPFNFNITTFGTPSLVNPYGAAGNPFPYTPDPQTAIFRLPISGNGFPLPFRSPYVQHYSFTVEQQLMSDLALSVGYVGNTSRKLLVRRDANAALFGPNAAAGNVNARRPYLPGTFGPITEASTAANSNYNSLQATLNKRLSRGFTVLASYTFGKAIDVQSDDISGALPDNYDRERERAVANFDVRHILATSWVWDLPRTAAGGWFGRQVLSGWQFAGIARFQTGTPFSVVSGRDTNLDGATNERVDIIGNPILSSGRTKQERLNRYFDPAAFAIPANGSVGNAGRNILYGPGFSTWDFTIVKAFTPREGWNLQWRTELFNAFNRANFGNPNSTLTSPNVGQILGAGAGRVIQFALRLTF